MKPTMLQLEIVEAESAERTGVDAIVNATDTELNFAGGVDMVVAHFGGPDLVREATALAPLDLGKAARTGPGSLATKCVIHVAVTGYRFEDMSVPMRDGALSSEAILKKATTAALALAHESGCTSIAIPPLARAAVGYPADEGARSVLEAVFEYFIAQPRSSVARVEIAARADEVPHFVRARTALAEREREAFAAYERATRAAREEHERAEREAREAQERAAREERDRAERDRAAREKAEWARQERERAERERNEREKAEWERAARERAQQEHLAREHAARERAAMEQLAREHAAREQASRSQVTAVPQTGLGPTKPKPSRPTLKDTPLSAEPPPSPPPRRSIADEKTQLVRDDGTGTARPRPASTVRPTLLDGQMTAAARTAVQAAVAPAAPRPATGSRSAVAPAPAPGRFAEEKTRIGPESAPQAPHAPHAPQAPPQQPRARKVAGPLIADEDDFEVPTVIGIEESELVEEADLPSDGPTVNRGR